jgi:hypothetical protein
MHVKPVVEKYAKIFYFIVIYYAVAHSFYVSKIILVGAKIVIWWYFVVTEITVIGVISVNMVVGKYAIIVYIVVQQ